MCAGWSDKSHSFAPAFYPAPVMKHLNWRVCLISSLAPWLVVGPGIHRMLDFRGRTDSTDSIRLITDSPEVRSLLADLERVGSLEKEMELKEAVEHQPAVAVTARSSKGEEGWACLFRDVALSGPILP